MNPIINEHFDAVEEWMLESSIVVSYNIIRKECGPTDGKLRIKVTFIDGSMAELFEYLTATGTSLTLGKYSFHWQDQHGKLKCRWDNAPHHPELSNAPHHKHDADETPLGVIKILNLFEILEEIERNLFKI